MLIAQILGALTDRLLLGPVPLLHKLFEFVATMRKRSTWTRESEAEIGGFGRLYFWIYKLPHGLTNLFVGALILLSLLSIYVGLRELRGVETAAWLVAPVRHYYWIVMAYLIVVLVASSNLLPRLLLWIFGRVGDCNYQPGWVNAARHVRGEDNAVPINYDPEEGKTVANRLLRGMTRGTEAAEADKAGDPGDLDRRVLANALLVATTIERSLHAHGLSDLALGRLYEAIYTAARGPRPLVDADSLARLVDADTSVYGELRQALPGHADVLPDEPVLYDDLQTVVAHLVREHGGDAWTLAVGRWRKKPSSTRANRRLLRFPESDDKPLVLREQFLKLAVDKQVWPGVMPKAFTYQYTRGIAWLLLETECLATRPKNKTVSIDAGFRRLVQWAEKQVVEQLTELVRRETDPATREYCRATFGCEPSEVQVWMLTREADYFFWRQSRVRDAQKRLTGGVLETLRKSTWTPHANTFTRS